DSAAWFAGLQEGDVLVSLDGKALASPEDLAGAVAGKEPGTFVELKFKRDGAEQTAKVRLGRRTPMGVLGLGNGRGMRMRLGPNAGAGPNAQFAPFGMNDDDADADNDNDFDFQMPDMSQFFGHGFPGMDGLDGAMQDLHG